jgi:hypothetical protein
MFATAQTTAAVFGSRDAQALATLSQVVAAHGGMAAINGIQDFEATGEITYYLAGAEVKGNATVRGRGLDQFRLDAALPEGTRSWAIDGLQGQLKEVDGTITVIPPHNIVTLGSLTLPVGRVMNAVSDSTTAVSGLGSASEKGRSLENVGVRRSFGWKADPYNILSKVSAAEFSIDPATFLITSIKDNTHPKETLLVDVQRVISFSDYRNVNGIQVPFAIEQTVNGQRVFTLTLNNISFNVGVSNADFHLDK